MMPEPSTLTESLEPLDNLNIARWPGLPLTKLEDAHSSSNCPRKDFDTEGRASLKLYFGA